MEDESPGCVTERDNTGQFTTTCRRSSMVQVSRVGSCDPGEVQTGDTKRDSPLVGFG